MDVTIIYTSDISGRRIAVKKEVIKVNTYQPRTLHPMPKSPDIISKISYPFSDALIPKS
jgi:hypothetical protein